MNHFTLAVAGAPGDVVAASGLVRDLAAHRPDIRVSVRGAGADQFFRYDLRVAPDDPAAAVVPLTYRATIKAAEFDRTRRYLYAAHADFAAATGIVVPPGPARPDLVRAPHEWERPVAEPYRLVAPGVKSDMPVKRAPPGLFAEVVRRVPGRWIQVGAVGGERIVHRSAPVPGVLDWTGRTTLRQLFWLIAHADVVVCHVSLPMLLAAAAGTPCVVLAGGREDPWLHAGLGVEYLDTIGRLPCCQTAGCRTAVPAAPHADSAFPARWVCRGPARVDDLDVGRCMTLITPDDVVAAISQAESGRHPLG